MGMVRQANGMGLRAEDIVGIVKTDNGEYCMIYYIEGDESIQ